MFDSIIETTEWVPLSSIPSSNTTSSETYWQDAPSPAVIYLVAHRDDIEDIGEEISHAKIGYVGQTGNCRYRVYSLRTTGHNCGKYIRQQGWSLDDIYVRCLFVEEGDQLQLEKDIHNENKKNFQRRFLWSAASAGNDGKITKIETEMEKCNLQEITEVFKLAEARLTKLLLEQHLESIA